MHADLQSINTCIYNNGSSPHGLQAQISGVLHREMFSNLYQIGILLSVMFCKNFMPMFCRRSMRRCMVNQTAARAMNCCTHTTQTEVVRYALPCIVRCCVIEANTCTGSAVTFGSIRPSGIGLLVQHDSSMWSSTAVGGV